MTFISMYLICTTPTKDRSSCNNNRDIFSISSFIICELSHLQPSGVVDGKKLVGTGKKEASDHDL